VTQGASFGYHGAMNALPPLALRLAEGAPRDPDRFLAWAANTPALEGFKVELAHGEVTMMMVHVSRYHARICASLIRLGLDRWSADGHLVTSADFGVRTPTGIRYPDLLVDAAVETGNDYAAREPIFIAEVLSPSSIATDMIEKRDEYLQLPTLHAYLICSQDEPRAWLFVRENGQFPASPVMIEGREASVHVPSLSLSLPMADIFARIPDAPSA
jgi:Uma2 family endonuclease